MNYDLTLIQNLVNDIFNASSISHISRMNGLTNRIYRVDIENGSFVFRLPGVGTETIINRKNEYVSTRLACELKIDAELIYFDVKSGIKISTFIPEAVTMSPILMKEKSNIILAANILKKLHDSNRNTGIGFDLLEQIQIYEEDIMRNKIGFYSTYREYKEKILMIFEKIKSKNLLVVPSHNDTLCENWIRSADKMYLVDWEYAGMNYFIWDLANLSIEANFEKSEEKLLLQNYLNRKVNKDDWCILYDFKVIIDFLWSLWGRTRIPYLGDKMKKYANLRYERMIDNLQVYS